eukprot:2292408-Karenia_brevis.AAC.1
MRLSVLHVEQYQASQKLNEDLRAALARSEDMVQAEKSYPGMAATLAQARCQFLEERVAEFQSECKEMQA